MRLILTTLSRKRAIISRNPKCRQAKSDPLVIERNAHTHAGDAKLLFESRYPKHTYADALERIRSEARVSRASRKKKNIFRRWSEGKH